MTVTTLRNNILFRFADPVKNGGFVETTAAGIYVGFQHADSGQKVREALVHIVGPDVRDVKVGDRIMIEPLQWTEEFKIDGESYWLTTEDKVIGILE